MTLIPCNFNKKISNWFLVFRNVSNCSKFKEHVCDIFFAYKLLILFWLTIVDIFCLKFESKNYIMQTHIPKEKNYEIKAKRNTFPVLSDVDFEEFLFF